MFKSIITFIIAVTVATNLFADSPGKAKMHESKITFQGVKKLADYTFYWKMVREDSALTFKEDITFTLDASNGAPVGYYFWAVNDKTKHVTDTVDFHNYYSPDYVIILNQVRQDSILYTEKELSNSNSIVSEGNTDSIANKQLVADAKAAKQKHYVKVGLLSFAGVAALGGLIWFFVRRKKNKDAVIKTAA